MCNRYANDTGYIASPARDISCFASNDLDSDGKFLGFCEWLKVDPPKSDLDRYLGEPVENRDKVSDVLAWWRVNAPRFPALGKMARDFLAIPISTILSKSTISGEATKVNPSFNGLGPEIIEAFICGQDWLESPENNVKPKSIEFGCNTKQVHQDMTDSRKQQGDSEHQMPRHQAGPFKVIKSTSLEDLKLINYVFYSSLDESEIVVHCNHNNYLTRSQLRTLRPQTCLDDNVISVMSDALTLAERRKKKGYINWYLPIFFSEYAYDTSECISFAKKHMFRENYMSALFSCEKMYVPVFDKERRHFYLFVLHMKKQVVEIWDSLAKSSGSSVDKRLPNILAILDILFEDDIQQNYPGGWSFASFSVDRSPNVPQQTNGYDCGVYVIKFMLAPEEVTQPDFVFDSDTERLDVVLGLLDGNVNSRRNELAAKAEAYFLRSSGTNDSLRI
ncbi:hypothetical protein NC651_036298 [Populus alba x Populus x berolinensis]|nr:hypothetical protein NC651_036298 [Populus alba x Populus x berolinensis]